MSDLGFDYSAAHECVSGLNVGTEEDCEYKNLFEKYICRVRTAHQPLKAPAGRQVCSSQHQIHEGNSYKLPKNGFATDYSNKL